MKSRMLFLAAAVAFLVAGAFQLRTPRDLTAAILDGAAGVIFLFLGAIPVKPT